MHLVMPIEDSALAKLMASRAVVVSFHLPRAGSFYYSVLPETLKARRTTGLDHERDDEVRSLRPKGAIALVE